MDIFFNIIGTKSINIGKIREIGIARKDALEITFDDGNTEIYSVYVNADKVIERFEKTIIQLILCTTPVYNVYSNRDGSYFHERVDYLALCADGTVRSLSRADICFELADEVSNFTGCFHEDRLYDYPKNNSEKSQKTNTNKNYMKGMVQI
jgi:hypothetical protein